MQYIFDLDAVDGWPPVEAESLHFDVVPSGYKLKSIPFFIHEIAYDDVLELDIIDETRAKIKRIVARSDNSTIWIYIREGVNEEDVLSKFKSLKIGIEGGALTGYFSLNLPKEVSLQEFDDSIQKLEENGLVETAYGELRHS